MPRLSVQLTLPNINERAVVVGLVAVSSVIVGGGFAAVIFHIFPSVW